MRTFFDRLSLIIQQKADGKHTVFAKKAGIPISTFQSYLSDRLPHPEHLLRISETFLVSIDWLLTGKGRPYLSAAPQDAPPNQEEQLGGGGEGSNVIELDHGDVIKRFQDKGYAKDLNMALVELERLSPAAYQKVGTYIKGVVDGVRMMAGKNEPPCADRRKGERRIEDDPDQVPEERDRRSGQDRRKAGANG